jgi:hypothetical protein
MEGQSRDLFEGTGSVQTGGFRRRRDGIIRRRKQNEERVRQAAGSRRGEKEEGARYLVEHGVDAVNIPDGSGRRPACGRR